MGEESFFLDILFLGLLAGFLVFRLRGVLGHKHGQERERPNPFSGADSGVDKTRRGKNTPYDRPAPPPGYSSDEFGAPPDLGPGDLGPGDLTLEERIEQLKSDDKWADDTTAISLGEGLRRIELLDPNFSEKDFVAGAKAAFSMILEAFNKGDLKTLRTLLDTDTFRSFKNAVSTRKGDKTDELNKLEKITQLDLKKAWVDHESAYVVVQYVSEQIPAFKDETGKIVKKDKDQPFEVTDIWTFMRDLRENNPNWLLVETASPA